MKKIIYILLLIVLNQSTFGQKNLLKGRVYFTDTLTKTEIPLDSVLITINNVDSKESTSTMTNKEGIYELSNIAHGNYSLKAYFRIYDTIIIQNVHVENKATIVDLCFNKIKKTIFNGIYQCSDFVFSAIILLKDNTFQSVYMSDIGSNKKTNGVFSFDFNRQQLIFSYNDKHKSTQAFKPIIKNNEIIGLSLISNSNWFYGKVAMTLKSFKRCYRKARK